MTEAHSGKDAMQYIAWGGYDLIVIHLATGDAAEFQVPADSLTSPARNC